MKTWTHNNLEWLYDLDLDLTWEESQVECPEGYRMATVAELLPFLDHTKFNPSVIDECPFGWNDTWTSDIYQSTDKYIYWSVNLITGAVVQKDQLNKKDTLYVRDV